MLQLLPLLTPHLSTPLPPPPKPAERQRCPTPASLPPRPCPTLAYLLAPQTSLGRSVPSSSCPGCLLSLSLSPVLCPVPSLPSFSWRGEGPLPLLFTPGIPKASLDGQERGTAHLFAIGHQVEWQASIGAGEETPPQVAQMTNRFPHFLVYPVAALIQALPLSFPPPTPHPRPALSQPHAWLGASLMPLRD